MNNKDLLKELKQQLGFIEAHLQRLEKKPDKIGEIDIDMMADKLKNLYARIFELETGIALEEIPEPEKMVVTQVEKPPVVEVKPEPEMPAPTPPEVKAEADLAPRPPAPDPDPVPNIQDPAPEDPSDNELPKMTADLFSGPTTIAEKFEEQEDKSIAAHVTPPDVEDLKMAIGINDKFLFINELFKGSPSEYNDAIDQLNNAMDSDLATGTMNTFKNKYGWADNSEAYHRLNKLLMSKFN